MDQADWRWGLAWVYHAHYNSAHIWSSAHFLNACYQLYHTLEHNIHVCAAHTWILPTFKITQHRHWGLPVRCSSLNYPQQATKQTDNSAKTMPFITAPVPSYKHPGSTFLYGSPISEISKHRVPELIPVLGSQPTRDWSHKPDSLSFLSLSPLSPLITNHINKYETEELSHCNIWQCKKLMELDVCILWHHGYYHSQQLKLKLVIQLQPNLSTAGMTTSSAAY